MIIDLVIILMVVSAIFRGRETGFVRQAFSTVGFFGGLLLGAWLERYTIKFANDAASEAAIVLVTVITTALLCLVLSEHIGLRIKHKVLLKRINRFDIIFGGILSVVSILVTVWFMAAVTSNLPLPTLQAAIAQSRIISFLDERLPSAPNIISGIGKLVDPNGFPQVFIGREPNPKSVDLPDLGELQNAVAATKNSVVKLEGQGCGGIVDGSGFVLGPNYVATNAHVIAGIKHPVVKDSNGTHTAVPIWFDPNLDFAVVRVSNLAGTPLILDTAQAGSGTTAAVLGFPGGGSFSASPAAVLDSFTASGRNIYGKKAAARDVYELRADVIPGNSGGPVINKNGSVIGVIFAESTSYDHVGYALTSAEVQPEIQQALAQNKNVSTGSCAE